VYTLKTQKTTLPNGILSNPRKPLYQTALSQDPENHSTKMHSLIIGKIILPNRKPPKPKRPFNQRALAQKA